VTKKILATVLLAAFLIAGCEAIPTEITIDVDAIATIVAATLEASGGELPTQTPLDEQAPPENDEPGIGTVTGTVCYPSEGIPAMTVYLENVTLGTHSEVPIAQNQSNWQAQVPEGTYVAYAWLPDYGYGGSYSQAVPCGLSVACSDHSLIEFAVTAGQETSGIDVCDWYGDPGDVPLPPGVDAGSLTGSISGTLSYPSEFIPAMHVVAFNVNSNQWFYVNTVENQSSYQIDNLPAGSYRVVSYPISGDGTFGGGYTPAVACGLSVNCTDHSLITVNVTAGQVASGVHPHDWYAPPGTFPNDPVP
jgi:hypothetical protein